MDMPVFRLYDTLSRTVKTLVTLEPNHLRFYSCGPTVYSYAHIGNFRTFLEKLIADGHAYETPTGVYFDTTTFARRGALSGNTDADSLRVAVRDVVVDDNKKSPADFALWKKDEKHLMQWYSPWGWGFPGWHIECSVMAMQYLGETIDLHGGGEDLVFPHHECEMAQSESRTGHSFCEHWVHTKFLQFEGEKMSKSKGTFFTARELIDDKGVHPLALRYALMSVPYSKPANFTMDLLRDSTSKIDRYAECVRVVNEALAKGAAGEDAVGEDLDRLYQETLAAMCEDLNTSVALAKALEGTSVIFRETALFSGASASSSQKFLLKINELLGIVPMDEDTTEPGRDDSEIDGLVKERDAAKANKDFARADAIRAELGQRGIELRDTPEGTVWRRKSAEI
ncbi:MAG: class I tRNA ligase family protein [Armatimonadetes bacterium]|nr:class I tRNA ligase family protein [Armatimonadota bacterium]